MTIELFTEVALTRDIPEHGLFRGDVATVVDHLPGTAASGGEDGYAMEVFNAVGESIAVVAVPCSAVEPLGPNQVLAARARLSPVGSTP
jgi:hypothetical protein